MSLVLRWFRAYCLTLLVEGLVAVPAARMAGERSPVLRRLGALWVANTLSHPAVWFIIPPLLLRGLGQPWWVMVVVAELWAWGSEVIAYRLLFPDLDWSRCALLSLAANAASFGVGLLLLPWL